MPSNPLVEAQLVHDLAASYERMTEQIGRVIVGQKTVVEELLMALFSKGHCLLVGVPGLAKTLLVSTVAKIMHLSFKRVQFTPDLMPSDITGTDILQDDPETGRRRFVFLPGPLFANMILADEINRTPPKTQAALLEAMQEGHVTAGGTTYRLPEPFFVLATQNPIEQEGTYPLPEAQVDRFMLKVKVGYPTREDEKEILNRMAGDSIPKASKVVTTEQIGAARAVLNRIYVDEKVKDYILNIVFATREPTKFGLKDIEDFIQYGASPRATISLTQAARAHAFLRHRGFVTPEDVKAIGLEVLRHRISLTYEAEAEELTPERIIQRIFERVEVP